MQIDLICFYLVTKTNLPELFAALLLILSNLSSFDNSAAFGFLLSWRKVFERSSPYDLSGSSTVWSLLELAGLSSIGLRSS